MKIVTISVLLILCLSITSVSASPFDFVNDIKDRAMNGLNIAKENSENESKKIIEQNQERIRDRLNNLDTEKNRNVIRNELNDLGFNTSKCIIVNKGDYYVNEEGIVNYCEPDYYMELNDKELEDSLNHFDKILEDGEITFFERVRSIGFVMKSDIRKLRN
jgi:hypothetical protein